MNGAATSAAAAPTSTAADSAIAASDATPNPAATEAATAHATTACDATTDAATASRAAGGWRQIRCDRFVSTLLNDERKSYSRDAQSKL